MADLAEAPKHAGGRPTVATPENVALAQKYASGEWENRLFGPKTKGWKMIMPTVEDLAEFLGISVETLYARDEFSEVLGQIKRIQANTLVNGGVAGELNPVMSKMVLSSKHGYIEKSAAEVDNKSSDGSMSPKEPASQSSLDGYIEYMKAKTAKEADNAS